MRILTLLLGVSLAYGCGAGSPEPTGYYQVDTLATGLVLVTNDGSGTWTPEARWRLEEDLRLGSIDEGGPEQFSQVAWIDEDASGRIFIIDYPAQDIRVFSADGQYSHTIGGRGQGPGEFTSAAGLSWAPDGNFWIWEAQRYSVFTVDGEFVTSWPRLTRGVIYPWNGGFTPEGEFIDWGLERERGAGPNETTGLTTFYPIRFTPPETYDTLAPLQYRAWMRSPTRMAYGTNRGIMLAQTAAGDLWFAHTDEYTLYRRSLTGDTTLAFSLPESARQISDAEVDSMIRLYVDNGFPERLEPEEFVRERRMVTRVLTDNRGHVFVLPETADVAEGSAVDVFRDDGVYLGRLPLPETVLTRGPPPFVTATHFYGVVVDDFDVPYVVRWRIVKPRS